MESNEGRTPPEEDRRKSEAASAQRKEYWAGFWSWFGLNLVLYLLMTALLTILGAVLREEYLLPLVLWVIPLAVNIGVMVWQGKKGRSQFVYGMLSAFGTLFVICLALSAVCFSSL